MNGLRGVLFVLLGAALLAAACAPPAPTPPKPSEAPKAAAPAAEVKPPAPTVAAKPPAPTVAPKPAAAASPAKPAGEASVKSSASPVPGAKPAAAASPVAKVDARAMEEFYRGKTVRVVVGFTPGGGADTHARALSRHLGNHIAGNPTIVVENMPGAGSLIAGNHLYSVARPDGLTLGMFSEQLVLSQVLNQPMNEFDARRFGWLGSPETAVTACLARADSGFTSFQQVIGSSKELIVGSSSIGDVTSQVPNLLKHLAGANFKVVTGYPGTPEIFLGVDRGEVDGVCSTWVSMRNARPDWVPSKEVVPLVQTSVEKHPELREVPLADEFVKADEEKVMLRTALAPTAIAKVIVTPPGVAPDILEHLRAAVAATYKDPAYLADLEKAKLELNAKSGAEVQRIVEDVFRIDPNTAKKLQDILFPQQT
jgi:tripartite-type tricarboxylate transporter receptor subunit TctC